MTDALTVPPTEGDEDHVEKDAPLPTGAPNIHAKHMSIILTVGTEDRDRSFEELERQVREALAAVNPKRVLVNGYYILDGKVCRVTDYDPKTQNFKPGTFPPSWAGGPPPTHEAPKREPIGRSPAEKKAKAGSTKSVDDGMMAVAEALEEAQAQNEATDEEDPDHVES